MDRWVGEARNNSLPLLYYLLQCTFYFRSPPASVGKKGNGNCTSLSCLSQDTSTCVPCPSVNPATGRVQVAQKRRRSSWVPLTIMTLTGTLMTR